MYRRIYHRMRNFNEMWFVAGGWAIDLYIEKETRPHHDIEITVFRKDQFKIKDYLKEFEFQQVQKGKFYPWTDKYLEHPIHEIHATNKAGDKIEILLNETDGENWVFRRDFRITYPIKNIYSISDEGIPYLNPEIVLLFKVKGTRKKDHQDFMAVKEYLNREQKNWLKKAISIHAPQHKWLKYLV